ncbi:MAG: DUF47 family protein [Anaerolineae bacterium]|nr:DUF47 family protein [Anaerolineae bacterium]
MSWLTNLFRPRQDQFTKLLIEQAACVVKGLDALNAYVTLSNTKTGEAKASDTKSADLKSGGVKSGDAKGADPKTGGAKPGDAKVADTGAADLKVGDAKGGGSPGSSVIVVDFRTNSARAADAVRQCEEDADEIRRILISELNRTFVTPFDREDISALSRAIDDIMDYAWSTVQEMEMLHVTPTPHLLRMVSLLREAAGEVHLAMLRIKDHPSVAAEHAQRAKALENRVEHVYREAIADLFDGPAGPKRVIVILKMREIYRHLSNAADRGDAAANIITDIVVKIT